MSNTCHHRFTPGVVLVNYCEQNFVLPSALTDALVNRLLEMGVSSEKEAENSLRVFLQGRRTDQGKMVLVRNYLKKTHVLGK